MKEDTNILVGKRKDNMIILLEFNRGRNEVNRQVKE